MKGMIIVLSLILCGCSTTSKIRDSYAYDASDKFTYQVNNPDEMTEEGVAILKARLDSRLASLGKLSDGTEPNARKININITSYYMRHAAARVMVGIMAGADTIKSVVVITDAEGKELGRIDLYSQNITILGTAKGLIEGHADKVVDFVTGVRK